MILPFNQKVPKGLRVPGVLKVSKVLKVPMAPFNESSRR